MAEFNVSLEKLVDVMELSLHPHMQGCDDCCVIKMFCDSFKTLEQKLTAEELKPIFAIPAVHLDGLNYYVGTKVNEHVKDRFAASVIQKSIVATVKCMKKHASDAFVQVIGCHVLYLATNKKWQGLMETLWSEGASGLLLSGLDMIMQEEKAPKKKTLPHGCTEKDMLIRCCEAVKHMYDDKVCERPPEPGLPTICRLISKLDDEPRFQAEAIYLLSNASVKCPTNKEVLIGHGIIDIILSTMRKCPQNAHLQGNAMAALARLCSSDMASLCCSGDALAFFVKITKMHIKSMEVQTAATQLYEFFAAYGVPLKEQLVKAGCVRCIVEAMNRFRDLVFLEGVPDMMVRGSFVLHRIIDKRLPDDLKTRIVAEGAGDEMIDVMFVRKDAGMQSRGLDVLSALMLGHPDNTKALGYQAISAVLGCMRTQKQGMDLLWQGCVLTQNILAKPCDAVAKSEAEDKTPQLAELLKTCRKYQDEFARCGGVKIMVDFLETQLKSINSSSSIIVTTRLAHACCAISHAAYQHAKNQAMFGKQDARAVLQRVIDACIANPLVLCAARAALEQLPIHDSDSESENIGSAPPGKGRKESLQREDENDKSIGTRQLFACVACGKTAAMMCGKKLLHCSACTLAPCYCSVECQRACWKEHKAECKANKK
jgi:hypothetical protein